MRVSNKCSSPSNSRTKRSISLFLSEVVYYLCARDVQRLAMRVTQSLTPEGDIVLVHWTGETNYPLTGDEAAEFFIAALGRTAKVERRDRCGAVQLDVLRHR